MEPISVIFGSLNFVKSIANFTGLIESLDVKIDKLSKAEFNAGINSLGQSTFSECERESLLREARVFFNKAISLEKDERLILSYLGLAICHFFLGDTNNCKKALEKALLVQPTGENLSKVGNVVERILGGPDKWVEGPLDKILSEHSESLRRIIEMNKMTYSKSWFERKKGRIEALKSEIRTYLNNNN